MKTIGKYERTGDNIWVTFSEKEWNTLVREAIRNRQINWDAGASQLVRSLNSEGIYIANLGRLL